MIQCVEQMFLRRGLPLILWKKFMTKDTIEQLIEMSLEQLIAMSPEETEKFLAPALAKQEKIFESLPSKKAGGIRLKDPGSNTISGAGKSAVQAEILEQLKMAGVSPEMAKKLGVIK